MVRPSGATRVMRAPSWPCLRNAGCPGMHAPFADPAPRAHVARSGPPSRRPAPHGTVPVVAKRTEQHLSWIDAEIHRLLGRAGDAPVQRCCESDAAVAYAARDLRDIIREQIRHESSGFLDGDDCHISLAAAGHTGHGRGSTPSEARAVALLSLMRKLGFPRDEQRPLDPGVFS